MNRKSDAYILQGLVLECGASILYKPLKDEVDYNNPSFPLKIHADNLVLPSDKKSDPFVWAADCIAKFQNTGTYILIPGTQFDIHGTRHGKGGGWYDRFLSKVSPAWLRIGVTEKSQISKVKLKRQSWDEPVDWIIAYDGLSWSVHDTRTRQIVLSK